LSNIHPTAVVSPQSQIANNVEIGSYAVVEANVVIGEGTKLMPHCIIKSQVNIGKNCFIGEYAVLGGEPQDSNFQGEQSGVSIGNNVTLREFATVHRATGEGEVTIIGNSAYIMAYVHISHNCRIGNKVTVANATQLAGHVHVDEAAFIGGLSGVHQFVRIGKLAMLGAHSYLSQDLPPYLLGSGHPFLVAGINKVGLKRAGFSPIEQALIDKIYRLAYRDNRCIADALASLSPDEAASPLTLEFTSFINKSARGIRKKTTLTQ